MVTKNCPSCSLTIPLATKTCTCGHIFAKKKSKSPPKDEEANTNANSKELNEESTQETRIQVEELYDEFKSTTSKQTASLDKLDDSIVNLTENIDEINKELENHRKNISTELKAMKEHFSKIMNEQIKDLEKKYEAKIKDQKNDITRLGAQVRLLTKRIEDLESSSESESDSDSADEKENEDNQEEIQANIATTNRFSPLNPRQLQERYETNECNKSTANQTADESKKEGQNILIASDSMMRRINGKKLSPKNNINMQYVRGGTEEMYDFIWKLESTQDFDKIVIHSGTNDVKKLSNEKIIENTKKIIQECITRWPKAEIIISGIIYHKTDFVKNDLIDVVNKEINEVCAQFNNVDVMVNNHITMKRDGNMDYDAFYDNIHLNDNKGIRKLAANLKKALKLNEERRMSQGESQRRRTYYQSGQTRGPHYQPRPRRHYQNAFNTQRSYKQDNSDHSRNLGGLLTALADWLGKAL